VALLSRERASASVDLRKPDRHLVSAKWAGRQRCRAALGLRFIWGVSSLGEAAEVLNAVTGLFGFLCLKYKPMCKSGSVQTDGAMQTPPPASLLCTRQSPNAVLSGLKLYALISNKNAFKKERADLDSPQYALLHAASGLGGGLEAVEVHLFVRLIAPSVCTLPDSRVGLYFRQSKPTGRLRCL
jgi:hypothetical protein